MELNKLTYCNKLMAILNDEFIFEIEPHLNNQNYLIFKAYRGKRSKWAKRFIIVNNTILQIKDNCRTYTYQINGTAGKNTKEVMTLDIGIDINQIKYDFEKYINE